MPAVCRKFGPILIFLYIYICIAFAVDLVSQEGTNTSTTAFASTGNTYGITTKCMGKMPILPHVFHVAEKLNYAVCANSIDK